MEKIKETEKNEATAQPKNEAAEPLEGTTETNELAFISMLSGRRFRDNPNFDFFVSQFVNSLERLAEGDPPYWHGRLIGLGYDFNGRTDFKLTFRGRDFTEKDWRDALAAKSIVLKDFTLDDNPVYTEDSQLHMPPLDPQVVTYTATISAKIDDGAPTNLRVRMTHKLRRTYLTYETIIEEIQ